MVANPQKLKSKIVENNFTIKTFSKAMGICEQTASKKISKSGAEFSISESMTAKELLHLSNQEYFDIFFGNTLALKSK